MKTSSIAVLAVAFLATAGAAQNSVSLLFTPKAIERTKSGSAGTFLRYLRTDGISVVTPVPGCTQSAERFSSDWNYQTMAGDENGDMVMCHVGVTGGIDAVLSLPYDWNAQAQAAEPRTEPVSVDDTFISPIVDVGTFVSGLPGLRKGDCGRIVRIGAMNGQVEHFITAEQIITALGMNDRGQALEPEDINLDAITVSQDRHIFLSFEEDHLVQLYQNAMLMNFLLKDGDVACIRAPRWTPNGIGAVGAVQPNRGIIALTEAQVDGLVVASNAADHTGVNPGFIIDTDAVATDRNGGTFAVAWGAVTFNLPNLLLSGESLTGAGVISTAGGGVIAVVNGCSLASAAGAATSGAQMGMNPLVDSSIENLESLASEPCYFVLGTTNPCALPGVADVHVGTNLNPVGGVAFLCVGLGGYPVSPSIDFAAIAPNTQCFRELYPAVLPPFPSAIIPVPLAAAGGGRFGSVAGWAPAAGWGLLFQALALDAALVPHASTPGTID